MFGNRSDGRKIKNIDPIFRLMPHLMKRRSDSHVYYTEDIPITKIDEYISKKAEERNQSFIYAHYICIIS